MNMVNNAPVDKPLQPKRKNWKEVCSKCENKNKCEDAMIRECLLEDYEHLKEIGSWIGPDRIHKKYILIKDIFDDLPF